MSQLKTNRELNGVAGETYAKQVFIFTAQGDTGYTVGDTSYGGEFKLFNAVDNTQFAIANTENNKMAWQQDGLLVWAFTAEETLLWKGINRALFQLFLILPTNIVDPRGTKIMIDTGIITIN